MATIVIGSIVFVVVVLAARSTWRSHKKGGCGCGCSGCEQAGKSCGSAERH